MRQPFTFQVCLVPSAHEKDSNPVTGNSDTWSVFESRCVCLNLHRIREAQAALAALSSPHLASGPNKESLEQFLAQLPTLWRSGEVRPAHAKPSSKPRHWRTRKDPFEGVWTEILVWLQKDPDATAKSLFERLQVQYPDRFTEGQLRTLQRRISEWRTIMARKLVHACLEDEQTRELTAIGR